MEKKNKEMESLLASQKEQLSRYETRLKDVVAAYKGLLKEKEALESSLAALTVAKTTDQSGKVDNEDVVETKNEEIKTQITTLMNSLATLSAEKSRMEASFQSDKKQLRNIIADKDKTIKSLQEKVRKTENNKINELENMKSKIIVERHEREKETTNNMLMIRELQKLYSDERHLRENLEMQLTDLKTQLSSGDTSKMKALNSELKEVREKIQQYENRANDLPENDTIILSQIQFEMENLKLQHAAAIKNEQKRALLAEETNKKLAALHEDRVANLEERLAELSNTVGNYDKLRQHDQESIQKLKAKIVQLANHKDTRNCLNETNKKDINEIVSEIMKLKKQLQDENALSSHPIDINSIFVKKTNHTQCCEDLKRLETDLINIKEEYRIMKDFSERQKNHIKILQDKVEVLNQNIDDQEMEAKQLIEKYKQMSKIEKEKHTELINSLEIDYRSKINDLEHQLQKQRSRSLQLLEEKDNEIKALKTSFEIIIPKQLSEEDNNEIRNSNIASILSNNKYSSHVPAIGENCHIIHYVNEIARKDIEIANLRKARHVAESSLRQALQDKVTKEEEYNEKIFNLEKDVDRLERCKSRENANLEYLKNVVLGLLSSNDKNQQKHMVNAIAAVLQFSDTEKKIINYTNIK